MILRKLREDAEAYLGEPVTEAVITVPAYFNDIQRQATKDAGRIAGLEVKRIINEPTSAALAYGLDNGTAQKIMVYDLGGGTFDVSIIEIGDGVIEVLATSGDNHLGGDDFDNRIVDYLVDEIRKNHKADVKKDFAAMQKARKENMWKWPLRPVSGNWVFPTTRPISFPGIITPGSGCIRIYQRISDGEHTRNRRRCDLLEKI